MLNLPWPVVALLLVFAVIVIFGVIGPLQRPDDDWH